MIHCLIPLSQGIFEVSQGQDDPEKDYDPYTILGGCNGIWMIWLHGPVLLFHLVLKVDIRFPSRVHPTQSPVARLAHYALWSLDSSACILHRSADMFLARIICVVDSFAFSFLNASSDVLFSRMPF